MSDRQLIADLLSALEYHTEQTRPIEFSKVAIEAAREYLSKPAQPQQELGFYGRAAARLSKRVKELEAQQQEPVALQEIARLHNRIKDLELDVEFLSQSASKQEPVALGALAKRRIFDYIRGAYDLGYNDARNSRAIPGDGAPGYKGRDVEADHGGALLHALEAITSPPASKPLTDEKRTSLRDAFAQALTSVYVCGRVWEAWQYGTMSEGDFQPAGECEEVLDSLIEAAHSIKENT